MSELIKAPEKFTAEWIEDKLQPKRQTMEALMGGRAVVAREMAFAAQILNNNDTLRKCEIGSVLTAVFNISAIGLTLNPALQYAYLVPMKGKCVLQPGYQGLVKLITDGGAVKTVYAHCVYENDFFEYELGLNPKLIHKPLLSGRGKIIGAYSVAVLHDGTRLPEVMSIEDIYKIRDVSSAYSYWISDKNNKRGPCIWVDNEGEMCRKTVIKRHYKQMPKSGANEDRVSRAIELDNEEYKMSDAQANYIESLLQNANISPEQDRYYTGLAQSLNTSFDEASQAIEYLKENQLNPMDRANPSQTDIKNAVGQL